MLSVEEALERILGYFRVLDAEEKPILECLGQVLAEDVVAAFDIPALDNSAMDGYAVRAEDLCGASAAAATELRVTATVAAGQVPRQLVEPGTAVRIMTGAPLPPGADAVIPFEDTDEASRIGGGRPVDAIGLFAPVARGYNVRRAGADTGRGQLVLGKGTVLRPAEVGVLASLGRRTARVVRRPVVAILATGDELLETHEPPRAGMLYDSNSYGLSAAVARCGAIPRRLGIARDTVESMRAKLDEAADSDMLVTSAGVSKGDYDMVKDVLAQQGRVEFWSVRMRPAKPLAFGVLRAPHGREVPHLGLPGNPVSALVAFEQFGRAAIRKMMGKRVLQRPVVRAVLEDAVVNSDGRRVYARAVVTKRDGTYYARLTGEQGSNLLTSLARANGLAVCPENVPCKAVGDTVDVMMLDWPEEVF